jgi:hypothetical protein
MRYFLPILLLLLLLSPAAAQEDSPFPVLDAEDVFAEGVTVLERLPILHFDNALRKLYYFNPQTEQWEIFDYPQEIQELEDYQAYTLFDRDGYLLDGEIFLWFDPETGLYHNPPRICGLPGGLTVEGWNLYLFSNTRQMYLCNSETEERIEIPQTVNENLDSIYSGFSYCTGCFLNISPDGHFAYLPAGNSVEVFDLLAKNYLYEIVLGEDGYFGFVEWLNNHEVIFSNGEALVQLDMSNPESGEVLNAEEMNLFVSYSHIIYVLHDESGYISLQKWDAPNARLIPLIENLCLLISSCESLSLNEISNENYIVLDNSENGLSYLIDLEIETLLYTIENADEYTVSWMRDNENILSWRNDRTSYFLFINPDKSTTVYSYVGVVRELPDAAIIVRRSNDYFVVEILSASEYPLMSIPSHLSTSFLFTVRDENGLFIPVFDATSRLALARWRIRIDALSEEES